MGHYSMDTNKHNIVAKLPARIIQYKRTSMFEGNLGQIKRELAEALSYGATKAQVGIKDDGVIEIYDDGWLARVEVSEADDLYGFRVRLLKTDQADNVGKEVFKSLLGDGLSFCLCPPLGIISLLTTILGGGLMAAQTKVFNKLIDKDIARVCADHGLILVK